MKNFKKKLSNKNTKNQKTLTKKLKTENNSKSQPILKIKLDLGLININNKDKKIFITKSNNIKNVLKGKINENNKNYNRVLSENKIIRKHGKNDSKISNIKKHKILNRKQGKNDSKLLNIKKNKIFNKSQDFKIKKISKERNNDATSININVKNKFKTLTNKINSTKSDIKIKNKQLKNNKINNLKESKKNNIKNTIPKIIKKDNNKKTDIKLIFKKERNISIKKENINKIEKNKKLIIKENKSNINKNIKRRFSFNKIIKIEKDDKKNINKTQNNINKNANKKLINKKNIPNANKKNQNKKIVNQEETKMNNIKNKNIKKFNYSAINFKKSTKPKNIKSKNKFSSLTNKNNQKLKNIDLKIEIDDKIKKIDNINNQNNYIIDISKNSDSQKAYNLIDNNRIINFHKDLLEKIPKKECELCKKPIPSHLYKIHYNTHATEVLNWLYLGSFENACDLEELKRIKATHILNCAYECNNKNKPEDIKELHLNIYDYDNFELFDFFEKGNDFINECRSKGGNILVHCKFGISRSASIVIAYLIKFMNYTRDSALQLLTEKRKQTRPNKGFMEQLHNYELSIQEKKEIEINPSNDSEKKLEIN